VLTLNYLLFGTCGDMKVAIRRRFQKNLVRGIPGVFWLKRPMGFWQDDPRKITKR
jgi:hypothetical protein